jgi:transcriptional regulator with XRE-family HTH domain
MTLAEYRKRLGWSQAELARQAGISYATVGKAEKGESINGRSALLICKALSRAYNREIMVADVTGWNVNV